jgi:aspartyl-tRNA(Asn)/glutamyl-tRNA(Gln) amidotransferase subunit C
MSDKIDINKIAKLSRLKLTESESNKLVVYLDQVIEYIDQLNELDTTNIAPTSHVLSVQNVFREDIVLNSADTNYLTASSSSNKGHYEVPKII